ncbi:MAG: adenylyl-sulfate kinase [Rhodospirillales bacterium]|nr:adenylyl-sulfate kinase [Rhodospirillales bacterium]
MSVKSGNIKAIEHRVSDLERSRRQGHQGGVFWLTGLPGSGKSTLAFELERRLFDAGRQVYVMDGDNLRHGLNSDLGFAPQDRAENIRRVGEVAALYAGSGMITLTAFISPYRADRQGARKAAKGNFHEIYLSASLEACEGRDPKGHYKMAREGKILDFTGISAPYEAPENPELVIDTGVMAVEESLRVLLDYVESACRVKDA